MSLRGIRTVAVAVILMTAAGSAAAGDPASAARAAVRADAGVEVAGSLPALAGPAWIVSKADNLCGLREASQLSDPAVVDFDQLLAATAEMKKVEREGIDPRSPEGVQLKTQATDRVREATEDVRQAQGHCSVWKAIRHKDGRTVADVTSLVLAKL